MTHVRKGLKKVFWNKTETNANRGRQSVGKIINRKWIMMTPQTLTNSSVRHFLARTLPNFNRSEQLNLLSSPPLTFHLFYRPSNPRSGERVNLEFFFVKIFFKSTEALGRCLSSRQLGFRSVPITECLFEMAER